MCLLKREEVEANATVLHPADQTQQITAPPPLARTSCRAGRSAAGVPAHTDSAEPDLDEAPDREGEG